MAASNAGRRRAVRQSEKTNAENSVAGVDRGQFGTKTRVYQIAKIVGMTSKEVIEKLGEIGIKKVAQSAVDLDDVHRLLDHIEQASGVSTGTEPTDDDRLRHRVEKNVENEINQITEKVEKELADRVEEGGDSEAAKPKRKAKATRKSTKSTQGDKGKAQDKAAEIAEAGKDNDAAKTPKAEELSEDDQREHVAEDSKGDQAGKPKPLVKRSRRGKKAKAAESVNDEATSADAETVDDEEKLRYRVEKNVQNEINQIEQKVEEELAARGAENESADEVPVSRDEVEANDRAAEEEAASQAEGSTDFLAEVTEELDAEPLEDVISEVTPPPARQPEFAMPLFVAPVLGDDNGEDIDFDDDFALRDVNDGGVDEYADSDGGIDDAEPAEGEGQPRRRRRGRRGTSRGRGASREQGANEGDHGDAEGKGAGERRQAEDDEHIEEPKAIRGSTRLEAQRRRRAEMREEQRKRRHIVSEAEFLARRESVTRTMVVRERPRHDHPGVVTQVGVLEDDLLVEHFVTADQQASMVGNIYLGRVQNVLPSMEAAFIDIGKGRNGVLYAGEVDWRAKGLGGRNRKIEQALKPGDQVLVQVSKDPVGHKGARLTTQISLAGRFLVYVPGGRTAGISRKLPAPERARLKEILKEVVPKDGGVIIRTAAEGVPAESIAADVRRLHKQWEQISNRTQQETESKGAKPVTLYEEPNILVKVVRDLFNEDFTTLVIDGERAWNTVHAYIQSVAPELKERLVRFDREEHDGRDAFEEYRIDEQLKKALSRKVWLPSGGTLVIDRTEAMTVIDVNTGKFTGSGGNLEQTVTRNNLEAAEEIVRQMRLRDLGGMIVVDFIDMVLPENQDLVLRRLTEALGRDRTRHQISEVTSLGLVQMTRKRLGTGLLETFATECEHCQGRGVIVHDDPVEQHDPERKIRHQREERKETTKRHDPTKHPVAVAMHEHGDADEKSNGRQRATAEELAAAVIALPEDESEQLTKGQASEEQVSDAQTSDERSDDAQAPRREKASRRRRGRRTSGSKSEDSVLDIVDAALDRAEAEDPDEPSGRDHLPATYEEAKAAFDASPRRKRRVRGNSVSDREPQPEDFADNAADNAAGTDDKVVEQKTGRDAQPEEQKNNNQDARRRRSAKPAQKRDDEPQQSEQDSATRVKVIGGRGRRRVVRGSAVRSKAVKEHTETAKATAKAAQGAKAAKSSKAGAGSAAGKAQVRVSCSRRRSVRRRPE